MKWLFKQSLAAALVAFCVVPFCYGQTNSSDGHAKPLYKATKPRTNPIELTGEVVDAWCYTSGTMGPGRGPRHKPCALACAMGGVTLGIVDDKDVLYIAAKHQGYTGCKELLTPFMAQRVHIKGWLAQYGGCNVIKIRTVELVK